MERSVPYYQRFVRADQVQVLLGERAVEIVVIAPGDDHPVLHSLRLHQSLQLLPVQSRGPHPSQGPGNKNNFIIIIELYNVGQYGVN